jgi:uncharacterized protein
MLSFDIRELELHAVDVDGVLRSDDDVWHPEDAVPQDGVHATGRLSTAGAERYYWHGHIAGTAVASCRRCLTETTVSVADEAHLIFAAEKSSDADDPDVYTFGPNDRTLDLRAAVRELWLLNVPTFVVCQEGCKGLCSGCGADLNVGTCTCESSATATTSR